MKYQIWFNSKAWVWLLYQVSCYYLRTLHVVFLKIFTIFLLIFCEIFAKNHVKSPLCGFLQNFYEIFAKFLQISQKFRKNFVKISQKFRKNFVKNHVKSPLEILFSSWLIKVHVAFVLSFRPFNWKSSLKPKSKGHTNFYECCDLTKKYI